MCVCRCVCVCESASIPVLKVFLRLPLYACTALQYRYTYIKKKPGVVLCLYMYNAREKVKMHYNLDDDYKNSCCGFFFYTR